MNPREEFSKARANRGISAAELKPLK